MIEPFRQKYSMLVVGEMAVDWPTINNQLSKRTNQPSNFQSATILPYSTCSSMAVGVKGYVPPAVRIPKLWPVPLVQPLQPHVEPMATSRGSWWAPPSRQRGHDCPLRCRAKVRSYAPHPHCNSGGEWLSMSTWGVNRFDYGETMVKCG